MPIVIKYAPSESHQSNNKIDILGITLFSIMVMLMTLFLNTSNLHILWALIVAIIVFFIYILKNTNAFITVDFFKRNKRYSFAILIVFVVYFAQYAFSFLYTFIVNGLYNSLELVSYILLPGYVSAAIASMLSDKITKKLGKRKTILLGISVVILGLVSSASLLDKGKLILSITGILFFSGYNIIYSPLLETVSSTLPIHEAGRGIGINDLLVNITASFGIAFATKLMVTKNISKLNIFNFDKGLNMYSNILFIFAIITLISLILYNIYSREKGEK